VAELKLLSDDEHVRQICEDYWAAHADRKFVYTTKQVAELHRLTQAQLLSLVESACLMYEPSGCCRSCGTPNPFRNRAEYQQRRRVDTLWVCPDCLAEKPLPGVQLADFEDTCVQYLRDELSARRAAGPSVDSLSARCTLYLTCLLQAGATHDVSYIAPLSSYRQPLTPTLELDLELLATLRTSGCICIAPLSAPDCVALEDGKLIHAADRVHWLLALREHDQGPEVLSRLEARLSSPSWQSDEAAELKALKAQLSLHEAIHYLRVACDEHQLPVPEPQASEPVLTAALREGLTYPQLWTVMARAITEAARVHGSSGGPQVSASIVQAIARHCERALSREPRPAEMPRDVRMPLSYLARALSPRPPSDLPRSSHTGPGPSYEAWGLASRLMAGAAAASRTPQGLARAVESTALQLHQAMCTMLGESGSLSLFKRAVHLTRKRYSCIELTPGQGKLLSVSAQPSSRDGQEPSDDLRPCAELLFAQLVALSLRLIGDELTKRALDKVTAPSVEQAPTADTGEGQRVDAD
jgi:hypothetical protein